MRFGRLHRVRKGSLARFIQHESARDETNEHETAQTRVRIGDVTVIRGRVEQDLAVRQLATIADEERWITSARQVVDAICGGWERDRDAVVAQMSELLADVEGAPVASR